MAKLTTVESPLTPELRDGLLEFIADRLGVGEVLVTDEQFLIVAEEAVQVLTGFPVDDPTRQALSAMLAEIHARDAALLRTPGVENWISLSVLSEVRRAKLSVTDVQEQGTQLIRDFLRGPKAKALLNQLSLTPNQINMSNCLRFVVNRVAGRQDDAQARAATRLARLAAAAKARPKARAAPASPAESERRIAALLEPPRDLPDAAESARRAEEQSASRARLRQAQMHEFVANLDNYVRLGRVTAEDAERLRKAHQVEQAVQSGRVQRDEGSKIRNSILSGTARDRIERQVKEALDYAVAYLQVFAALQRIDGRYDPALRFLARHGNAVNSDGDDGRVPELLPLVEALLEDSETLRLLIEVMDRKDGEVRMIAARLPPYNHIVKRDQGCVERVAVDEGFIGELREKPSATLAAELHSGDRKTRARPAAAMLSLAVLVNRLIKPTPFRKELRLLKVNLIIEEFYQATLDVEQARQRAQDFLRGRLRSLYPDLSREETAELQRRGDEIILRVEERVLGERAAAKGQGGAEAAAQPEADGLSEEDRRKGVQIRRVSVRTAAGVRLVPYKVMPDPEDEERHIIVQRDPNSGEMVPIVRRGAKRHVERGRDGSWELARE